MTTKAYDKELLSVIARRYSIFKGDSEPEEEWKARLIYSICGMMAYASLLDISPDDSEKKSVSIEHVKERICRTLTDYITIYPETAPLLPNNPEQVAEEIKNQFINSGIVYHSSQRLTPAMFHENHSAVFFSREGFPRTIFPAYPVWDFMPKSNIRKVFQKFNPCSASSRKVWLLYGTPSCPSSSKTRQFCLPLVCRIKQSIFG